jgi:hypothetical protein
VHVLPLLGGFRVRENFLRDVLPLLGGFRVRENFSRYRFTLFHHFLARKTLLALPIHPFPPFLGTQDPPRVTVSPFSTVFGNARASSRYRFTLFHRFRERKNLLSLPFHPISPFPGTQDPSRVTVPPFFTNSRHARTFYTYLN